MTFIWKCGIQEKNFKEQFAFTNQYEFRAGVISRRASLERTVETKNSNDMQDTASVSRRGVASSGIEIGVCQWLLVSASAAGIRNDAS
jgi:hypothetical protein